MPVAIADWLVFTYESTCTPSSCSDCAPLYLDQRVHLQLDAWLGPPWLHSACPEPTPLTINRCCQYPLNPPSEVTRNGEYEMAPIRSPLDNRELFEITSPTILNRDKVPEGMFPVEVRAEDVNRRLWRALLRTISGKQTPIVTIDTLNNSLIIQISDDQSTRRS